MTDIETFPTKPGDWIAQTGNHSRLGIVKAVYFGAPGEVLVDLLLVNHRTGDIIGRESPAMGGPRTFEPAVPFEGWERIEEPNFPIPLAWLPGGAGYFAGPALPHLAWKPRKRRSRLGAFLGVEREGYRRALEEIAQGANDARAVARKALGK